MIRTTQTASHWGVYDVQTSADGTVTGTRPYHGDAAPSAFVDSLPALVRSRLRIDRPYARAGFLERRPGPRRRGSEPFVPLEWDRALDLVAAELERVKSAYGNEAIYAGTSGWASAGRFHHAPTLVRRFLGLYGGFTDKRGNQSYGAALGLMPYVLGRSDVPALTARWPSILAETKLVVMFGGAHPKNMQVGLGGSVHHGDPGWFARAAEAGIAFINISPSRENLPEHLGAEWLALRPNTDTALMLALAHVLASEGLHDRAFLDRCVEGYARFEDYLFGRAGGTVRDAAWAAAITGIPADRIVALARRMASTRTLVATSWSVQRGHHGEQPVWATIALAAMLGQIGLEGGGFSFGLGAADGIAAHRAGIPRPVMPVAPNPVKGFVPVGRFTDALLAPGSEIDFDGTRLRLPELKLIYSVGGNPFHHATNLNRMLEGWQRPETIVVHEPWWNPLAKHADIVLPATTTMERNDLLATDVQQLLFAMRKVIDPVGEARNDYDVFAALAERLNFREAFTEGRDETAWLAHLYEDARERSAARGVAMPPFAEFWERGSYEPPLTGPPPVLLAEFRADPRAHRLATPSGKIELYSERIASFGYDDAPPHPAWLEPAEWLGGALAHRYPLHLLSNQPRVRLHSQHDAAPASRAWKVGGRERLEMAPYDAAARGLASGDVVRVFNERGAFLAGVSVVDHLLPGVVQIATGAWYDPLEPGVPGTLEKHGNPNVVTRDGGTSRLTQSSVAQTALVEVERALDPPAVTAFEPPEVVSHP